MELIDRIAALVPPPRVHHHRYHGVLAPNSPLRGVRREAPCLVYDQLGLDIPTEEAGDAWCRALVRRKELHGFGDRPDDQAVLQYAMGREHLAMQHYRELADRTEPGPIRDLFEYLANEEAQHKEELEKLYYETVQPVLSLPSIDAYYALLTPRRLDLLRALRGDGPLSIRALSRQLQRDYKNVHTDTVALIESGLVERDPGSQVSTPWDRFEVSLPLQDVSVEQAA